MTAVPELKTHWRLGKAGREEGKLYPTCLKTSSTFWWSGGLVWVTFKRINIEHRTVLTHGYRQAEGNVQLLQKYSQPGWERAPAATCGWGWDPPGSLQCPSPSLPAPLSPLLFRYPFPLLSTSLPLLFPVSPPFPSLLPSCTFSHLLYRLSMISLEYHCNIEV